MIQTKLFLPFTPNGEATERSAIKVKQALRLGPYASVDPFSVLERVPARLLTRAEYGECPSAAVEALFTTFESFGDHVSAIGYAQSPVTGEWLIFVNGTHHPHRQRASLMEEVVHIVLDHPKVILTPEGVKNSRTFDKAVEDEAFNVGAACVLPYRDLFFGIKERKETVEQIAAQRGVSTEYVAYRIKRAGLTNVYKKNVGPLAVK